MKNQNLNKSGRKSEAEREDRLKSALKANLARRKAQMRARASSADTTQSDKNKG